jgi:DNA-binding transcriptional ArsR family regulator
VSNDNEHNAKVFDKFEDIDNELKRIRSDTNNINRILTLTNSPVILQELRKAVGGSKIRAAILLLTKDEIPAGELAEKLRIKPQNLARDMKPFLGNKGYVTVTEVGTERRFQRSQLVDLVGFESIPEFAKLLKEWEEGLKQEPVPRAPVEEQSNES